MADITNENWLPIPGWEGFYSVSDMGRVRSEDRITTRFNKPYHVKGRILKASDDKKGYLCFNMMDRAAGRKAHVYVHQIVLFAFVGPPPAKHEVRHKDGNSLNNRLDNLCYGTRTQNIGDAKRHGTFPILEKRPGAKLTREKAIEIAKSTKTAHELAKKYGVKTATIQQIRRGDTWSSVTEGHRRDSYARYGMLSSKSKLTDEQVLEIYKSKLADKPLALLYGVSPRLIWSIKNGTARKRITGA